MDREITLYRWHSFNLTKTRPPEALTGTRISATLLPMLGVQPTLGRFFSADEAQPSHDLVAIITYGFWKDRFAGGPDILGKTLSLDDETYTIVGVMPQKFRFIWDSLLDVMVPLALTPADLSESARASRNLETLARLKAGISQEKA